MKRPAVVLPLLAGLFLAPAAESHPVRLGTITADATTSQTNASTAVAFKNTQPNLLSGMELRIQCDANAWIRAVTNSTDTATKAAATANAIYVEANQFYPLPMGPGANYVAVLCDSGTCNCRVSAEIGPRPR